MKILLSLFATLKLSQIMIVFEVVAKLFSSDISDFFKFPVIISFKIFNFTEEIKQLHYYA